jgi:hypothetical protein
VARKLGVHRREVRKALTSAMPAERKVPERERPKRAAAIPFINAILEADRKAPRKQRHTVHWIWMRLRREEPEAEVAESTVLQYVRARKAARGLLGHEIFVPQSYQFGGEAQGDGYEGWVEFDGEARKMYVFCLRSMASGGAFHRAYPHANQQAFLEAHELAFAYFGGVFRILRYDNLKSAVKKILRGHPTGRNRAVHRFSLALGIRMGVLYARRGTRERRRGGRRGPVAAELSGAHAERAARAELNLLLAAGSREEQNRVIQCQRVRESVDELLFGAIAGGHFGPGEGLLGIGGGLVSGQVRGPAGALL